MKTTELFRLEKNPRKGLLAMINLSGLAPKHISIAAIAFNQAEYFQYIKEGNPIDVCYSIVENYYRGIANIQLRIRDIKEREDVI